MVGDVSLALWRVSSSLVVVTQSRNGGDLLLFPRRKSDNGRRKLGRPRLPSPPSFAPPLLPEGCACACRGERRNHIHTHTPRQLIGRSGYFRGAFARVCSKRVRIAFFAPTTLLSCGIRTLRGRDERRRRKKKRWEKSPVSADIEPTRRHRRRPAVVGWLHRARRVHLAPSEDEVPTRQRQLRGGNGARTVRGHSQGRSKGFRERQRIGGGGRMAFGEERGRREGGGGRGRGHTTDKADRHAIVSFKRRGTSSPRGTALLRLVLVLDSLLAISRGKLRSLARVTRATDARNAKSSSLFCGNEMKQMRSDSKNGKREREGNVHISRAPRGALPRAAARRFD